LPRRSVIGGAVLRDYISLMSKRKKAKPARAKVARKTAVRKTAARKIAVFSLAAEEQVFASDLTLHELFAQQTAAMLDRADLSDEQRQAIMIGMSCPCCGGGGFSFTAKLKPTK